MNPHVTPGCDVTVDPRPPIDDSFGSKKMPEYCNICSEIKPTLSGKVAACGLTATRLTKSNRELRPPRKCPLRPQLVINNVDIPTLDKFLSELKKELDPAMGCIDWDTIEAVYIRLKAEQRAGERR